MGMRDLGMINCTVILKILTAPSCRKIPFHVVPLSSNVVMWPVMFLVNWHKVWLKIYQENRHEPHLSESSKCPCETLPRLTCTCCDPAMLQMGGLLQPGIWRTEGAQRTAASSPGWKHLVSKKYDSARSHLNSRLICYGSKTSPHEQTFGPVQNVHRDIRFMLNGPWYLVLPKTSLDSDSPWHLFMFLMYNTNT